MKTEKRQDKKTAECLGDLVNAKYFFLPNNTRFFFIQRNQWDENSVYIDDGGNLSCIGFIKNAPKNCIKITVSRFGIQWESIIKLSLITCIYDKK